MALPSTVSLQAPRPSPCVSVGAPRGGMAKRVGICLGSLPPTGTQEGVRITLDCAQAAFISYDKMVISLKGGEM